MAKKETQLRVTLIKSVSGRLPNHKACATGLGLRKIRSSVTIPATPCNLGMINKISYLLSVEEVK